MKRRQGPVPLSAGSEDASALLSELDRADEVGLGRALKRWIEGLGPGALPLAGGAVRGGLVDDTAVAATVLATTVKGHAVEARVGIFFTEVVGGCSCGDDPVEENAYCELRISIDRITGHARLEAAAGQVRPSID